MKMIAADAVHRHRQRPDGGGGSLSPFNDQRSVILLADSPRGYQLPERRQNDSANAPRCLVPVAVIRESGVHSLRVGDIYYAGHLPV